MDSNYNFTAARMHAEGTITYGTPVAGVRATATITYGSPSDGDTVVVDGTTFTKAAAGSPTEFSTIAELTALITALASVNATDNGTVITIVAAAHGTAGNAIALSKTGTALVLSSATLLGGVAGDTVVVNGTTCTCVDAGASGNQFTSAATLATIINALANINAANASGVITIKADAVGTTGNTYTLALGGANAGTMTISGATLTGGAAALYTDPFDIPENFDSMLATITVTDLSGGSPTADWTIEGSVDGGTTYIAAEGEDENALSIAQMTSTGSDRQFVKLAQPRMRIKLVLGGTSPRITARVSMVARND